MSVNFVFNTFLQLIHGASANTTPDKSYRNYHNCSNKDMNCFEKINISGYFGVSQGQYLSKIYVLSLFKFVAKAPLPQNFLCSIAVSFTCSFS